VSDTPTQQVAQHPPHRTTSSDYRAFRVIPGTTASWLTQIYLASKKAFLTQLTSTNIRSREFPNTLAKMLASQEDMNTAMSLQGDDALTLVDILDQVSRPRMIGTPRLIPRRLLGPRTWSLTSAERVSTSSGESVVQRQSCHVHAYSQTIFQRRVISPPFSDGPQMSGTVATTGSLCV
jgi:hypothetical protein